MQFAHAVVGSTSLQFVNETTLAASFTFARPVSRVQCLLRGFELSYPDRAHQVAIARIDPRVEFQPSASATTGTVRVTFALRDDGTGTFGARTATFEARLLLLGE